MKVKAFICVLVLRAAGCAAMEPPDDSSALWQRNVTDSGLVALFATPAENGGARAAAVVPSNREAGTTLRTLHKFYKKFISSQQGPTCCFNESCSVFGVRMMEQKGFIKGMLIAFDRVARCNGVNPKWYEISPQSRLNIDNYESCIP
jgi:putative component of membrane protein insertase Oxa1/YidC/SpoIIIJ protein YidD